jgi:large subunit ribosomal protein L19
MKISSVNIEQRKKLGLRAGDTVKVMQKIKEKDKFRLQAFEGIVISRKHGDEAGGTFTIRKVTSGVGVEKIFPIYSPMIDKIEIVKRSKVRRAKLYHIRNKATKEIKHQMRNVRKGKGDQESVAQEAVAAKAE